MTTVNTIKEILDQKRDELLKQVSVEIMSQHAAVDETKHNKDGSGEGDHDNSH